MGRRRERRGTGRRVDDHEPPLTARQMVLTRHQLFVDEFRALFGDEWVRTMWRAVERRLSDSIP